MKSLQTYLAEARTDYAMRLKLAKEPTSDDIGMLENCLQRFGLKSLSSPKRTVIQSTPMDFSNLYNTEVYIMDAMFGYPVTSQVLEAYIAKTLGVSENMVRAVSPTHPEEQRYDLLDKQPAKNKDQTAEEKMADSKLMDSEYKDAPKVDTKKFYGSDYNKKLVADTQKAVEDRSMLKYVSKPKPDFDPNEFAEAKTNQKSVVGSHTPDLPKNTRKP